MARKGPSAEQVIETLREVDARLGRGQDDNLAENGSAVLLGINRTGYFS